MELTFESIKKAAMEKQKRAAKAQEKAGRERQRELYDLLEIMKGLVLGFLVSELSLSPREMEETLHVRDFSKQDGQFRSGWVRCSLELPEHRKIRFRVFYFEAQENLFPQRLEWPERKDVWHIGKYDQLEDLGDALNRARMLWHQDRESEKSEERRQQKSQESLAQRKEIGDSLDAARLNLLKTVCDEYPVLYSLLLALSHYTQDSESLEEALDCAYEVQESATRRAEQRAYELRGQLERADGKAKDSRYRIQDLENQVYDLERKQRRL